MSFSAGFAAGLAVGKKKWGGGDDDWQPPDWWIEVPEPEPYEMYFLVLVFYPPENVQFVLSNPVNVNTGGGNVKIDWGDGTVYDSAGGYWSLTNLSHKYNAEGGGSTQNPFWNKNYLFLAVINCKNGGLPRINAFRECSNLRKINIAVPPKVIGDSSFLGCKCLTRFDFSAAVLLDNLSCKNSGFTEINAPLCTSIGDTAFDNCYNLRSVNAPLCTSVGSQAFLQCYDLRKAVFAEDCVFGSNCFENCVSLYPRPDESTN